jgi:broad specificity phosphatase PhoE
VRSFLVDAIERTRSRRQGAEGEGRILVVAHATLNRILLCVALGVPVRDFRRRFRQDPANLTILRFPSGVDAGALLVLANDTAHLGMTPPGIRER